MANWLDFDWQAAIPNKKATKKININKSNWIWIKDIINPWFWNIKSKLIWNNWANSLWINPDATKSKWIISSMYSDKQNKILDGLEKKLSSWKINDPSQINSITKALDKRDKTLNDENIKQKKDLAEQYDSKITEINSLLNNPRITDSQKNKFKKLKTEYIKNIKEQWHKYIEDSEKMTSEITDKETEEESTTDTTDTSDTTETSTTDTSGSKLWATAQAIQDLGYDGSYDWRKAMAAKFGIENYRGTAEQNQLLLEKAKANPNSTDDNTSSASKENPEPDNKDESGSMLTSDITWKDSEWNKIEEDLNIWNRNIWKEEFESTQADIINEIEWANEDANAVIEQEWQDLSDEQARQRKGLQDDIAAMEDKLDTVEWRLEYKNLIKQQALAENLQRSKNIASRWANIWAAAAGQGGVWLPASELQAIQNDILAWYDANISKSEQAAITEWSKLDETLEANLKWLRMEQSTLNNLKDIIQQDIGKPFAAAIKAMASWDKQAIEDVKAFINEFKKKEAERQFDRGDEQVKVAEWEKQWKVNSQQQKIDFMIQKTSTLPWAQLSWDSVRDILNQYPNLSYLQSKAKVAKVMALNNNARVKLLTILGTDPEGWTDDMKAIVKQSLWEMPEVLEQSNPSQAESEIEIAQTEEIDKDVKPTDLSPTEINKWFKWFKTEKAFNIYKESYNKLREAVANWKIKWKDNYDLAKKKIEEFKIKNSI